MWTRDRLDATDPLLLALPVLLGLAAGILVVRGVRVVTAGVRRLAGRGRSVASLVGASQAGTTAQQVMLPIVALVLAAGSGMLAVAVDDSVRRGAEAASWQQVGADVRVSEAQLDEDALAAIGDVPGVETVAPVYTVTGLLDTPTGSEQVTVVAVAPDELAEVASHGPDPTPVPEQRGDRLGIVAAADLQLDEPETTLRYAQATMPVTMTAEVDEIAGLEVGRAFVVVDAEALRVASDRSLLRAQTLLLAGDPDPARLTEVVHEAWPTATVTTRADVTRSLVERPAAERALLVARISAVVSVLLALLATGLAVTLGRPVRRRTLEVLHALGGDPRQGRRVAALEMFPSVLGAGLAACGAVLLLLLATGHGIDLAAVSGGADEGAGAGETAGSVGLALGATSWLAAAALLAGLVVLAAAAPTWRTRRSSPHEGETR
jgi:putative ABC transport system permease protein